MRRRCGRDQAGRRIRAPAAGRRAMADRRRPALSAAGVTAGDWRCAARGIAAMRPRQHALQRPSRAVREEARDCDFRRHRRGVAVSPGRGRRSAGRLRVSRAHDSADRGGPRRHTQLHGRRHLSGLGASDRASTHPATFSSAAPVRAFVNGRERPANLRRIRLTPHAQIVLEIGGYVAPHPAYLFPKGTP